MPPTLLIGDNSFIGVSHLSQIRARERLRDLDVEGMAKVVERALSVGATGYTFSTHPTNLAILRTLRDSNLNEKFDLFPVLPYAEGYVRIANEKGTTGLFKETLSRLSASGAAKAMVRGLMAGIRVDPTEVMKTFADVEIESYLRAKPRKSVLGAVLLHDIVTDLVLAFRSETLIESFIRHVRDHYGTRPGFVTRNFTRFVTFFREKGLSLNDVVVMSPFNKAGFQMNPSQKACENTLASLSGGYIIAMSIMAAGYLDLSSATEYLAALPNLSGVAVGVSSMRHAEETFPKLRMITSKAS